MKKLPLIILMAVFALLPLSCRQPVRETASPAGARGSCFDVLLDTTATFAQIQAAVIPWADSLRKATADTVSLEKRITAQQFTYITIELLASQVSRLGKAGEIIPYEDFNALMNPLLEAANQWLYTTEDGLTSVWRDIYYASNQEANSPVESYFHIMVVLPDDDDAEPELHIFFPESARNNPGLLFRKYKDYASLEEDEDSQELIPLEEWYGKGELDAGYPMYASAGSDIVEKMLEYDLMYILFSSGSSLDGRQGTNEMARVGLMYFQDKYTEAVGFD
jgi:hypothetical protein